MTDATERRASIRRMTATGGVSLVVMDWTESRITRARLLNVSSGGALILADTLPILDQPLSMRLEHAADFDWTLAIPVRFGPAREVGVKFIRPSPLDFLWEVTIGAHLRGVSDNL